MSAKEPARGVVHRYPPISVPSTGDPQLSPKFGMIFRFHGHGGYDVMFVRGLEDGDFFGIGLSEGAWPRVGEMSVFDDLGSPAWSYVGRADFADGGRVDPAATFPMIRTAEAKGHIIHLDGNPSNYDIENLRVVKP